MKTKKILGLICMLTVVLPDTTQASLNVTGASVDEAGNLSITAQKVLTDETTKESVNDGPAITLTETSTGANATAVATAINTAALALYAESISTPPATA